MTRVVQYNTTCWRGPEFEMPSTYLTAKAALNRPFPDGRYFFKKKAFKRSPFFPSWTTLILSRVGGAENEHPTSQLGMFFLTPLPLPHLKCCESGYFMRENSLLFISGLLKSHDLWNNIRKSTFKCSFSNFGPFYCLNRIISHWKF